MFEEFLKNIYFYKHLIIKIKRHNTQRLKGSKITNAPCTNVVILTPPQ